MKRLCLILALALTLLLAGCGMAAGSCLVKAICLERATGTVEVTVQPGQ